MSLKIDQISPSVIRDLDASLPNWRDLIPEDKAAVLNEETLIQLLKDRKRAETYRLIADKRNIMFREMYTSEDKSVLELTKEFGTFSYEQTAKWWEIENKLNSIILQFRSKKKIDNVKKLRPVLNTISKKVEEAFDVEEELENSSNKATMNNIINRITGGDEKETKKLNDLFSTQIPKFQQDNKLIFSEYKEFVNETIGNLIKDKISRIEKGELTIDALQRSDLFTNEEIENLKEKQNQMTERIIDRRSKLNMDSFEDVIKRSLNITGKDKFLEIINKFPEDLISHEVKEVLKKSIDDNFILPFNQENGKERRKRAAPAIIVIAPIVASTLLSVAASFLKQKAKEMNNQNIERDMFYTICNKWSLGFGTEFFPPCVFWTLKVFLEDLFEGRPVDLDGIANVLGFAANVISFSASWSKYKHVKNAAEKLKKAAADFIIPIIENKACSYGMSESEAKYWSILCDILTGLNQVKSIM